MRSFLMFTLLAAALLGAALQQPTAQYRSSGAVRDIVADNGNLYSATDASCIDVFDMKIGKLIQKITVEKITDFMGDVSDSTVYSVDVLHGKVVLLSQAEHGFRRVHLYQNGKTELLIPSSDQLYIAKVRFLDDNTLLLGLLGSEIVSYDIENKKENWRVKVSQSKFSDLMLNEKKDQVVIADESGALKIHRTKDGSWIRSLAGQNLDNVFQVDYKNGIIATAGQDRRVVIYDIAASTAYYKTAPFLIYSVGLSPSGKIVGFASDEYNNVTLFDTSTQETLGRFGGNKMTLTNILFLNEKEFLVSSGDTMINLYQVKGEVNHGVQ
ncbi:MAG: WD40 repeat domain-containing protein [Thiovulaceae bacterium]|nr:WD40 repeat domain-containing protein [Sulfurimonadaceae bacterium]